MSYRCQRKKTHLENNRNCNKLKTDYTCGHKWQEKRFSSLCDLFEWVFKNLAELNRYIFKHNFNNNFRWLVIFYNTFEHTIPHWSGFSLSSMCSSSWARRLPLFLNDFDTQQLLKINIFKVIIMWHIPCHSANTRRVFHLYEYADDTPNSNANKTSAQMMHRCY